MSRRLGVVVAVFAGLLLVPTSALAAAPANDDITAATMISALPFADTVAMQLHLEEISRTVARRSHAVRLLDRAGLDPLHGRAQAHREVPARPLELPRGPVAPAALRQLHLPAEVTRLSRRAGGRR